MSRRNSPTKIRNIPEPEPPAAPGISFSPLVIEEIRVLDLQELHEKMEYYTVPPEIVTRVCEGGAPTTGGRVTPSGKLPMHLERHGKLSPASTMVWDTATREAFKVPESAHECTRARRHGTSAVSSQPLSVRDPISKREHGEEV